MKKQKKVKNEPIEKAKKLTVKKVIKTLTIIAATVAGIGATIKLVAKFFNKKNNIEEKLGIKDVFVCIGAKTYEFAEKINKGVFINSYVGCVEVDLSACDFEDNSFITIKSFASKVNLIVPADYNVKFDFVNSASYIKWNVEDDGFDETRPTIYVGLKTVLSVINVVK